MSARAKRLERFLSEHGWETGAEELHCRACRGFRSGTHCNTCGKKLVQSDRNTVIAELERAIAYALGETK